MSGTARAITLFSRPEIRALFKTARRFFRGDGFDVRRALRSQPLARVLIVIKGTTANAVKRNKIRRRIKAIFYEQRLYQEPYDYIIIVGKQSIELSYQQLSELLQKLARQST